MDCDKDKALKEVEQAKLLIKEKHYKYAKASVKMAMDLDPNLDNGFGMLVICETLCYADMKFPDCGIDWYSVLHLPPSVNNIDVQTQSEFLIKCTTPLKKKRFPGSIRALNLLNKAKSMLCDQGKGFEFDSKREEFQFNENRSISSKEGYLNWKPPITSIDGTTNLRSFKKPRTTNSVEGEPCLSPELRTLKNQVFDKIPQHPHFLPLEKYGCKVREGMKLGLDLAFVNLSEEIRKLVDPQSFLLGLQDFKDQLSQLEEMGYNVEKLRERLETLQRIAESEKASRDSTEKFEVEVKDQESAIINFRSGILKLEAKINKSKVLTCSLKRRINVLKEESRLAVNVFASTANSQW